jgi:crossover junction endodeoxyribonuclease RusA
VTDLRFTQPNTPLSVNKSKGAHWSRVRAATEPWKLAAFAIAHNTQVKAKRAEWVEQGAQPITVQVVLEFPTHRRRDPHNYTGTVVKAIVDGIVMAGVVPDDTPDWVTVLDPVLEVRSSAANPYRQPVCTVRIRPREDPTPC